MKEKMTGRAPRAEISPELVKQARAGDQAAFAELYEQTSAGLYRSVRSMVRDEDLAWDILQEAYLQAWHNLGKLQADEAFLAWLRRIAVTMTAKKLKERQPLTFTDLADEEGELPELPDLSADTQPELALDRKETARLVREILAGLPEQQQLILGMRYYEDMPVREIADLLGIAPGTVRAQLCFGRKKVEAGVRALEKQGVKLYGLSPLPFLLALLRRLEPAASAEKKVLSAVLADAPAAAGSSAVSVTALTAGQVLLKNIGVALLAVAAAAAVIVGGKLAYDALKRNNDPPVGPERPTITETAELRNTVAPTEHSETEPPAPVLRDPDACGDDLTWSFDADTGTLTIMGSGGMYDYNDNIVFGMVSYSFSDDYPVDDEEPGSDEYLYVNTPWQKHKNQIRAVELPDGLTSVGAHVFSDCSCLESISIPDTVTSIGENAFYGCQQLSSVQIPETVVSIGEKAFCYCSSLRSLEIPANVAAIGTAAFGGCTELEAFSVHPENAYFEADADGVLYSRDHSELIAFPGGKSGSFEIPEGVTVIGGGAFSGCKLSSVTIPEGVTTIGDSAFSRCYFLSSAALPTGLTTIGDSAFYHCGLTDLRLPASLTSIGKEAFYECYALTDVTIPGGVTVIEASSFDRCSSLTSVTISDGVTEIGKYAFFYCDSMAELTIPGSVRSIGESAFADCDSLTELTIPEGVVSIGESAFAECAALRSLTLPDGLTDLGKRAFAYCAELRSVTLPASLTSLGTAAFTYCSELRSVTLPASLTSLGTAAFADCSALEAFSVHPDNPVYASDENGVLYSKDLNTLIACPCQFKGHLEIPDGVTSIDYSAFSGCEGLHSVTIPESVTAIDAFAFSGCTGLSSVALPEGMTTVESLVFYGCTGLRSVTFPESLTTINARAFLGCSGLTRVSIPENVSFIGEGAFGSCTALEGFSVQAGNSVYTVDENGVLYSRDRETLFICPAGKTGPFEIPTQVTTVKSWSFYGCSGLSSVAIPESVTYIGACAFYGCSGLTDLTIPGSVSSIGNGAFSSCASLNSVTISEGVTAIGYEAFDSCRALSAITIPESVTSIPQGAIYSFGETTIYSVPGSEAERYAEENMIPFEALP